MGLWKNVIETELCLLCNLRLSLYCRPMLPQHPDWDYSWSTGYKRSQGYLPDDNVRQEGSYKGDQGEKPNPRGSQCVQINLVSKYLFDQREKKTIGQKMKFKTIRSTNFSRGMYLDPSGLLAVDPCHSFLQTKWGPLCWSAPPENQEWARILFYDAKAWWAGWYLIILVIFANQHLYGDVESNVDRDR